MNSIKSREIFLKFQRLCLSCLIILVLLVGKSQLNCSEAILIYDALNGKGTALSLPIDQDNCVVLPRGWSDKIASIDSKGFCIQLFKTKHCNGILVQAQGYGVQSLSHLIQRPIQSVGKCESSEPTMPSDSPAYVNQKRASKSGGSVTLYEYVNYQEGRQLRLIPDECTRVSAELDNNIASVDATNNCVRLYDGYNCDGSSIQIQPNDPEGSNLDFWDFIDRTSSVGPCVEFQQLGLQLHNYLRSTPIYLNENLNIEAQAEAESLARQAVLPLASAFISGELLYTTTSTMSERAYIQNQIIRDAINSWYNEKIHYVPTDPSPTSFTQLIWKDSSQLGIGLASYGRRVVVLAKYRPVGNIQGDFGDNVDV